MDFYSIWHKLCFGHWWLLLAYPRGAHKGAEQYGMFNLIHIEFNNGSYIINKANGYIQLKLANIFQSFSSFIIKIHKRLDNTIKFWMFSLFTYILPVYENS